MADIPFMLQGQPQPQGMGMGSNGIFNMGQWGSQPSTFQAGSPTIMPGAFGMPNTTSGSGGWWDNMKADLGNGMEGFNQGVSAFTNLAGIYAGFKSLGLAKDQFKFAKSSFNKNFNASAQAYNNELKDQWAARNASAEARGQSYEGMDTWMSGRQIAKSGKGKDKKTING